MKTSRGHVVARRSVHGTFRSALSGHRRGLLLLGGRFLQGRELQRSLSISEIAKGWSEQVCLATYLLRTESLVVVQSGRLDQVLQMRPVRSEPLFH
jgi:hypothetical protein